MKNSGTIKLEAVGDFPFTFYIEKAVAVEDADELIIEGIASTTNVDHDNERMSKEALQAMADIINKEGVPLRVEHQKDGTAVIGSVFKGWVDERNQLHIRSRLDKTHAVSPILHHSMKNGVKMGLSVGGVVKRAVKEFVESVGGMVKTFYDVQLQEVSVTPRPANYDSWLVAKSIAKNLEEAEDYSDYPALQREFLLENSQLDYLQAFSKSIPDKAWRKVESPIINKEGNQNIMKENSTDETETTKVSRAEFDGLSKAFKNLVGVVSKGFESVSSLIKAMDNSPKDQHQPDKEKPEDESASAKAMDGEAHDQNNPGKDKPDDESPAANKTSSSTEEATKAGSDDKEETTKLNSDDAYDLETISRSITKLQALGKRIRKVGSTETETDGTKKTETETEGTKKTSETETEATKNSETDDTGTKKVATSAEDETTKTEETDEVTTKHHPLDIFVATVTKMMEDVVDKMEKSNRRVLGFEKSYADDLVSDPRVQAELAKLMKVPGFKKSVALGVPYMLTKDGKRFPLTAVPEQVEKSTEAPKDFKTLYKSKYSSVSQEAQE